jgi:hypothetical protein
MVVRLLAMVAMAVTLVGCGLGRGLTMAGDSGTTAAVPDPSGRSPDCQGNFW